MKINLEAGFPEGREMVFQGKGDEHPDAISGDLIVKVNLKADKRYRREGADLYYNLDITLKQALLGKLFLEYFLTKTLGFKKTFQFLDGSPIKITSEKGKYISQGDKMTLKGKGMPFFKRDNSRGDLHITFNVKYPEVHELDSESIEALQNVFNLFLWLFRLFLDRRLKLLRMVKGIKF